MDDNKNITNQPTPEPIQVSNQVPQINFGVQPQGQAGSVVSVNQQAVNSVGSEAAKPSNRINIIGVLLCVVVLLISLSFVLMTTRVNKINKLSDPAYVAKNKDFFAQQEIAKSLPETIERSDNIIELGELIDTSLTIREQDIKTSKSTQINTGDGFSWLVSGTVNNWVNPDSSVEPDEGKQFFMVILESGYRGKDSPKSIDPSNFYLVDSNNKKIPIFPVSREYATNNFFYDTQDTDFTSLEQKHGWAIFEISETESATSLVYEKRAFTYKGESIAMKAEVAL